METKSLLFPAYQKFYSALRHLDAFNTDDNLFDNISSLDAFFSEFRNITFVLKKSLAHTEFMGSYDKYLEEIRHDLKWFVSKRNETIKQQPFDLLKKIKLIVYSPERTEFATSKIFTSLNDQGFKDVIEDLKSLLNDFGQKEVFFSASFSFYEQGNDIDIWDSIIPAVKKMDSFLSQLSIEIVDTSEHYQKIQSAVINLTPYIYSKALCFTKDYVYYPMDGVFERAEQFILTMGVEIKAMPRKPLEFLNNGLFKFGDSAFSKFVLLHVIQQNMDIFPAIMTVFTDNTFEIDAFNSSIKTTWYRKINEVADQIKQGIVKEVFLMASYVGSSYDTKKIEMTTRDRATIKEFELLAFTKADHALDLEEFIFYDDCLSDIECIKKILNGGSSKELTIGKKNINPIIEAFKKLDIPKTP